MLIGGRLRSRARAASGISSSVGRSTVRMIPPSRELADAGQAPRAIFTQRVGRESAGGWRTAALAALLRAASVSPAGPCRSFRAWRTVVVSRGVKQSTEASERPHRDPLAAPSRYERLIELQHDHRQADV